MMAAASRSRPRKRTIRCSPRSDRAFFVTVSLGGGPSGLPPEAFAVTAPSPACDNGVAAGSLEAHGVNVKNVPAAPTGAVGASPKSSATEKLGAMTDIDRRSLSQSLSLLALAAMLPPSRALAAGYPTRPIHLIVGITPGASSDIVARLYAKGAGAIVGRRWWSRTRPAPAPASPPAT